MSGWFKTETNITLNGKTPRLLWNHNGTAGAGGAGFNLQFFSGSQDLKLDVDDDTTSVNTTGDKYADKQAWVFFGVTYDGTVATNNVKFYKGYRNSTESAAGTTHRANPGVLLMGTFSLNRGVVNTESVALVIGNRTGGDRPFDGFIDEIQIEGVTSGNGGALTITQLEAIRVAVVPEPSAALLVGASLTTLGGIRRRRK